VCGRGFINLKPSSARAFRLEEAGVTAEGDVPSGAHGSSGGRAIGYEQRGLGTGTAARRCEYQSGVEHLHVHRGRV
jgi:hypothetical protein